MEGLQQKLDDKDKEIEKVESDHQASLVELKQDKKRYEELLAMKESELERQKEASGKVEKQLEEAKITICQLQEQLS